MHVHNHHGSIAEPQKQPPISEQKYESKRRSNHNQSLEFKETRRLQTQASSKGSPEPAAAGSSGSYALVIRQAGSRN